MISISRPILLMATLLALPIAGASCSAERFRYEEQQRHHRLYQTNDHNTHR